MRSALVAANVEALAMGRHFMFCQPGAAAD